MRKRNLALAPMFAAILLAFGLVLGFAPDLRASVYADYGDAPDPSYPSLYGTGASGPYHSDVTKEWIGTALASTTTKENDSIQAGDLDDGFGWFTRTADATGRTKTWFVTNLTRSTTRPDTDNTYLNVLVDLDKSGKWSDGVPTPQNEWAVRNVRVPFEGLPVAVQTITMVVRVPDAIIPGNLTQTWIRETIGEKQVNDGTGAWGAFNRGETEDWITDADGNPPPPPTGEVPTFFWPKVNGITSTGRLKAIPKTAFALCPQGDCIGPVAPVTPVPPANIYDWQMYVPAKTTFLAISQELGRGCSEWPVAASNITCPSGALAVAGGAVGAPAWSVPPIIGPGGMGAGAAGITLGAVNTFRGWYALTGPTGHAVCAADYMMIFDDPGGPYIGVYDNLTFNTGFDPAAIDPETGYPYPDVPYDPKHPGYVPLVPIPEPAAFGLLGLALLGLHTRKRR